MFELTKFDLNVNFLFVSGVTERVDGGEFGVLTDPKVSVNYLFQYKNCLLIVLSFNS